MGQVEPEAESYDLIASGTTGTNSISLHFFHPQFIPLYQKRSTVTDAVCRYFAQYVPKLSSQGEQTEYQD